MKTIKIRQPMWGRKAVGIKPSRLVNDWVCIDITYKQDGKRLYPRYYIKTSEALACPTEVFRTKSGMFLRVKVIPLEMMSEKI